MGSRRLLGTLPLLLSFLSGCAVLKPVPNPLLAQSTVEIRGDTALYRGHYRTGGVRSEVTLVRGVPEGTVRLYFADSVLEMESRYRGGKAEGEAVTYFPNGRRRRVEYHAGDSLQPERAVEFDSTGSRISEWRPEGRLGTGSLVLLREGRVTDSAFYRDGRPDGMAFALGAGGDTVTKVFYREGKLDSLRKWGKTSPRQRSTESILRTFRRKVPDLRHAYNACLADSRSRGKVTLKFGIRPDGHVAYLLPMGDTSGNPRFVRAVVNAVQDWKFESLEQGDAMDVVTVPFTFSP